MFYWIYTKKNESKPIISRNFNDSHEAVRFAVRNGSNWEHGEMLKKGERYGEFHKGKIRIGSKIESSIKPKAPVKRVAKNCDVIVTDSLELRKVLFSLDSTSAKWKNGGEKPSSIMPSNFPMVIHVRNNRISYEPCINAGDINNKIKNR